jgi:hypothetical protein
LSYSSWLLETQPRSYDWVHTIKTNHDLSIHIPMSPTKCILTFVVLTYWNLSLQLFMLFLKMCN